MKPIRIGSVGLAALPPRIAVPLVEPLSANSLLRLRGLGADLLELRLDLFPQSDENYLLGVVRKIRAATRLPLIATVRRDAAHPWPGPETRREKLFLSLLPFVDAVDLELEATLAGRVARQARTQGRTVILSHHDYRRALSPAELSLLIRRFRCLPGNILKIAVRARKPAEVIQLLYFTRGQALPLITVVMGEWASLYRALAPLFGSRLTYAYYRKPTAPGQPALREMRGLYSRLYPTSKKRS
ncbi:MAG: type I 3-dehydroquinate dehydratase [Proteobacteria bacterium]|nr:type I 3-dehydroquinate dehydratase [Pseudomonadota bacterium]